ncbi:MAG TPA: Ig-like domain-containing protein, partial [Gemmatimonadales bacterium]|nr:Ig-like domain-containing protein [Gemmatimonadales bacterium]
RSLRPTATFQLAAEVRSRAGRPVPDAGIRWVSSDTTVVRVHPDNGWISAVGPGRAIVVATSGEGRDSVPIMVRRGGPAVVGARLAITPVEPLRVGEYGTLRAVARNARGVAVEDTALAWSSSDPTVLGVDPRTGEIFAQSAGSAIVTARGTTDSASAEVTVLPVAVAGVIIQGARPLVVGERLTLAAIPTDRDGRALRDRPIAWTSSDTTVLHVDAASGLVAALSPGSVDVTATSEDGSGTARVTVFARDVTSRAEGAEPRDAGTDAALLGGAGACYGALLAKDADRVTKLYHPLTPADEDNLKKLRRILRTRDLLAVVGERVDGEWKIEPRTASLDFSFRLTWRDEAGGRRGTEPVFRAEFARQGNRWAMSSCRIVGTPELWP